MTPADNEHEWFTERLAASLAGGLDAAESERFDAHARACPDCAALLAEAQAAEAAITAALADLRPAPGLEDRIMLSIPARGGYL
jgi:anti-sigma factor RsiW